MERRIVDYGTDEQGDPIAILDCGHPQHIRHNPPFINRPWTQTQEGRRAMLGQSLNCVRCDEAASWFSLSLGDALTADARLREIEEAFADAFTAAGKPAHMAVFKRHDTEHSLQCEVTAYFSPAAADIARAFGAHRCARPSTAGLDLLGGDPHCRQALFADAAR